VRDALPPLVDERLRALRARPIEPTEKGFGSLAAGGALTAATLAADGPALHAAGFTYPLLTLRETALRDNIAAMADYCARAGVALAPHGKTAMSPELAARQLAHGAWGITVATIGQMQAYRAFGFPRLLLANELVDRAGIAWLGAELAADPGFEAYCYVDSLDGVRILDQTLERHRFKGPGRRLPVLVEIGHAHGRTGCRTDEQALAVAKAADATGTLAVAGVAGYEGSIGGDTEAQTLARVAAFCRRLRDLGGAVAAAGPAEPIVTAGGSAYFDVVTRELTADGTAGLQVILRSGAYLTYDHGFYGTVSPGGRGAPDAPALRPALELWAQVLSRPEPDLALLGAGRRDAGFDKGLPVPLGVLPASPGGPCSPGGRPPGIPPILGGNRSPQTPPAPSAPLAPSVPLASSAPLGHIIELNDQHAYLRLAPGAALAPGDLVALGISHPCTTLDKWRVLVVVNDEGKVTDAVHAFF
jgi:D-serine deaminase-like pyridoxal phosphate-dependent protein